MSNLTIITFHVIFRNLNVRSNFYLKYRSAPLNAKIHKFKISVCTTIDNKYTEKTPFFFFLKFI